MQGYQIESHHATNSEAMTARDAYITLEGCIRAGMNYDPPSGMKAYGVFAGACPGVDGIRAVTLVGRDLDTARKMVDGTWRKA